METLLRPLEVAMRTFTGLTREKRQSCWVLVQPLADVANKNMNLPRDADIHVKDVFEESGKILESLSKNVDSLTVVGLQLSSEAC